MNKLFSSLVLISIFATNNIALLLETDQFVIINNDEGKIIDLSILSNHFNAELYL